MHAHRTRRTARPAATTSTPRTTTTTRWWPTIRLPPRARGGSHILWPGQPVRPRTSAARTGRRPWRRSATVVMPYAGTEPRARETLHLRPAVEPTTLSRLGTSGWAVLDPLRFPAPPRVRNHRVGSELIRWTVSLAAGISAPPSRPLRRPGRRNTVGHTPSDHARNLR